MRNLILLPFAFIAVSSTVLADGAPNAQTDAQTEVQRCGDGNQQQMNACMGEAYGKADARLNSVYRELIAALENPSKLRRAQQAWLRFRDLSCDYETSGIGRDGSLYPFSLAACRLELTEKRISELERYLAQDCNGCPPRKQPATP